MELISVNERHYDDNLLANNYRTATRRVPTLRDSFRNRTGPMQKYFPLLCITQAIIIGLLLSYVYWFRSNERLNERSIDIVNRTASSRYRVYSNGLKSVGVLLDLVAGCDQRRHDLYSGSVKCESNNVAACTIGNQRLEPPGRHLRGLNVAAKESFQVTTTSKAGKRLEFENVPFKLAVDDCRDQQSDLNNPCDFKTKLTVHVDQAEQSIIGWGGALTDSSINNIFSLSTNGTMQLLDDYFGPNGLRFNMIRVTIGGSDFSARFYTNDDLKKGEQDDLQMQKFRLETEDLLYKIPILKYIQERYNSSANQIKLFASMWSPPIWMKTNNHFNKGQLKGSIGKNPKDEGYFRALAELKRKFLLAYRENSIQFWGLTVMNEPVFSVQPFLDFNTMIFPKNDYANYVAKYLRPMLRRDPHLEHIKLIGHDDNRRFLIDFIRPTLLAARNNREPIIDGVSVHGYIDQDYNQMDRIYKEQQQVNENFFVLPTELCSGHLPWMQKALAGNWHRGIHYALDIINSLQHSAAGWVDWNMALDMDGGPGWLGGRLDSPILVDKEGDLYHKSPMFYILGHFSRYIPPESRRIKTTIVNDKYNYQLETVTFQTPDVGQFVTIVLNTNPHPIKLYLQRDRLGQKRSKLRLLECEPNSITTIRYDVDSL